MDEGRAQKLAEAKADRWHGMGGTQIRIWRTPGYWHVSAILPGGAHRHAYLWEIRADGTPVWRTPCNHRTDGTRYDRP